MASLTNALYFSDKFEWNKKGLEDMALKYVNKVSLWLFQSLNMYPLYKN